MNLIKESLNGVKLFEPKVFGDERGFFFESYNQAQFAAHGISDTFVQDNVSMSEKGILRGLHQQLSPNAQAKLVQVLEGEVFDVAVDCRPDSPTYKQWVGEIISQENKRSMYIPVGFAHGFYVLSEKALFSYKCSDFYSPANERVIAYNDPTLAIEWPIPTGETPTLSERDKKASF